LLAAKDLGIQLDLYILGIMSQSHAFDRNRLLLRLGDLMKEEVLKLPFIKENQVIVTGTPQFEPHFDWFIANESGFVLNII
jgi:hypothetical protein